MSIRKPTKRRKRTKLTEKTRLRSRNAKKDYIHNREFEYHFGARIRLMEKSDVVVVNVVVAAVVVVEIMRSFLIWQLDRATISLCASILYDDNYNNKKVPKNMWRQRCCRLFFLSSLGCFASEKKWGVSERAKTQAFRNRLLHNECVNRF